MSGLIRNLITLIQALLSGSRHDARARVVCHFLVTPLDCGVQVLKSDKYFQLAESAQLDFLVKTGLMGPLLRQRIHFVNASQIVKFVKPVRVFSRVRVETSIICADEKFAYFSHALFTRDTQHGEVIVKMKFKKGALTVAPAKVAGELPTVKPAHVVAWDQSLAAMD